QYLYLQSLITHIDSIDFIFLGKDCPRDWSLFGSRCFRFFKAEQTWTMAEKTCNNLGGNLASIHNSWENVFISGLIDGSAWLGGHDMVQVKAYAHSRVVES
uniref:C-type lectin domain-containing protein n=1 Tax=Neogobius melanostomus TaxID=47308 RepID=A0A8C6SSY1_9GOBI